MVWINGLDVPPEDAVIWTDGPKDEAWRGPRRPTVGSSWVISSTFTQCEWPAQVPLFADPVGPTSWTTFASGSRAVVIARERHRALVVVMCKVGWVNLGGGGGTKWKPLK